MTFPNGLFEALWQGVPLAQDSEFLIPIMAILMTFGIPVVAILTHHQRKMAELVRGPQNQQGDVRMQQQLEYLQAQISELRGLIQEHIIKNDLPPAQLQQTPPPAPAPTAIESIEQRLNG
jgi:hypothetical protein